jgi:hypothetical protein
VAVVSNEPLGLTLADSPLRPVSDAQDETLRHLVSVTARNATKDIVGKRAVAPVTTEAVAAVSGYESRAIRSHLASLTTQGLLKRKGERGGWLVADWLLSDLHGAENGLMPESAC